MRYKVRCPIHHDPYETSEKIYDHITDSEWEKQGGASRWIGYILLLPNPWNHKKAVLICGGNKGMGTQAALLRVIMAVKRERPLEDTSELPAKLVKAIYDPVTLMVNDVSDL